jgi:hypothetical protein
MNTILELFGGVKGSGRCRRVASVGLSRSDMGGEDR